MRATVHAQGIEEKLKKQREKDRVAEAARQEKAEEEAALRRQQLRQEQNRANGQAPSQLSNPQRGPLSLAAP